LAQKYATGMLMGDEYFENDAESAPLMRGDYQNLPIANSLKKFTPIPGSQGSYGTCTGWSCAYAGRTILEAMRNKWEKEKIHLNAFSPSYIYNQIRMTDNCYGGASLIDALNVLKNNGGLKMDYFGYDCDREVTKQDQEKAKEYTIIEYREVADRYTKNKVERVKKSLSENKPVIIALDCPDSFFGAGEVWMPKKDDYKVWSVGHALCAIGYDDNIEGGAIEIINSWGVGWGENGYTWIRYDDFQFFCLFAFELIDKGIQSSQKFDLSGSLKFIESNGEPMRSKLAGNVFETEKSYATGTLFELLVSNNQPAYVYAFGTDLTNVTYKVFPFHDQMIAFLPYRQNNIAIPDEGSYNLLDDITGTTSYVFLYSKESLDIDLILKKFESQKGTVEENLEAVLGEKYVDTNNINFEDGETITFNAFSNGKSVVPIIFNIPHK